ncbi:hypothetical protein FGO68_gene3780 [Halteria grandinella]|uniref:RING-type domain-containing protein n=1 Tax=Halteria grandinella TaxID=5974 RepID=A0A8J8T4G8_HALGN|nr:hypothetical protein FGO68_gene3780 [Halteria grandinella]
MNNFPPLLINESQTDVSGTDAPALRSTAQLADSLVKAIRQYRKRSIKCFLLHFGCSIAQIMIFGILIQAFVIKLVICEAIQAEDAEHTDALPNAEERIRKHEIEEQYEDLSSEMNAAAYSSVLLDIFFFMLQQKSLELKNSASLNWQSSLYRYRWIFSIWFLTGQLTLNSTVLYFAAKITQEISKQNKFNLNQEGSGYAISLDLMVAYLTTRLLLFIFGQLIQQNFWLRQVKILYKLTLLPNEWRIQALSVLENGDEQERRQNEHDKLMNKIPKMDAKELFQKVYSNSHIFNLSEFYEHPLPCDETKTLTCERLTRTNFLPSFIKECEMTQINQNIQESTQKERNIETLSSRLIKDMCCIICLQAVFDFPIATSSLVSQGIAHNRLREVSLLSCNENSQSCSFYHTECLSDWLKTKRVCPLCRDENFVNTHILDIQKGNRSQDQIRKKQSYMKRLWSQIYSGSQERLEQSSMRLNRN